MIAANTIQKKASSVTANARAVLIGLVLIGLLLIQEPMAVGG